MTMQLKPTLGTLHLWGIAVGLVISGEYFGWSYGWGVAGTLGFLTLDSADSQEALTLQRARRRNAAGDTIQRE